MSDTETPEQRPSCGYNTNPNPNETPTPCGSEENLSRVFGQTPGGVVCGQHRIKVWTHHDVERIEPLDRTTK